MNSPRSSGVFVTLFALAAVAAMTGARDSGAAGGLRPAAATTIEGARMDVAWLSAASRKPCRLGQRYSSYYRKCVLWWPLGAG